MPAACKATGKSETHFRADVIVGNAAKPGVTVEHGHPDSAEISAELDRLMALDLDDLRIRYRQVTRKSAPSHIPKWLLQRMAAYRLQASKFGDLDSAISKLLERVAREQLLARNEQRGAAAQGAKCAQPALARIIAGVPRKLRAGTQLVREFNGELHRVTVLDEGYSWEGRVFTSLSEAARAITGTNWNGPAFFGLRSRKPAIGTAGDILSSPTEGAQ
jgi:hypothetical protein